MSKTFQSRRMISRRHFLQLVGLGGAGLALAGCAGAPAAQSTAKGTPVVAKGGEFDWKKYSGKTVRVLAANEPATSFIEPRLPQFEKLTGIKLNWEKLPEDQQRQKLAVELASGVSDLDVYSSQTGQEGLQYMNAGWYELLQPWIENKELTAPDYDFADFDPNAVKQLGEVNDKIIGIPDYAITFPLYYRKDLLDKAQLKVPETMDDLEAAAKKLKSGDVFGITLRGKQAAAVGTWAPFMLNMDGSWLDANGKPAISAPNTVASIELYGRLLREAGPPGTINMNWTECQNLWLQGKAALFSDSSAFVGNFEDPKQSKVVNEVGYALLPVGKNGKQQPGLNGWVMAMNPKSKNKEPGWYFIQWASNKAMCDAKQAYGIQQARKSAWQSEAFQKGLGAKHPDLVKVLLEAYAKGKADLYPPFVNVAKARDIIGLVIVTAIQGGDVKGAAQQADQQLLELQKATS